MAQQISTDRSTLTALSTGGLVDVRGRTIERPRVVHAMPGAGKSHFARRAAIMGVLALDTDLVIEALSPTYFAEKPWRRTDPASMAKKRDIAVRTAIVARSWLARSRPSGPRVVVTNLWSAEFRDTLLGDGGRLDLTVGVPPAVIHARSVERGGSEIPLDVATMWYDAWTAGRDDAAASFAILDERSYIGDMMSWDGRTLSQYLDDVRSSL